METDTETTMATTRETMAPKMHKRVIEGLR
jgi:hypothetical protein